MTQGICYLVGAGPGDPGLLTLKGRACLEQADVVFYDALSNPALLQHAPDTAEKIFVGKRAGKATLPQEEINTLLIEKTKSGKIVVRLKGGDPYLFGRGGEEAEALVAAGCRFETVPGISSVTAGPAYAGIPLTHRDHNNTVTIFTGHQQTGSAGADWNAIAKTPGTKVMVMGLGHLEKITQSLQDGGMAGDTPAALIRQATRGDQQTLTGTLAGIAKQAAEKNFAPPALAVFGDVVKLRKSLNWFESLPLSGQKIVITRSRKQAGKILAELRTRGAEAYELPTIQIEPHPDKRAFYEMVAYAHSYDWLIFTSPNGVDAFFAAFYEIFKDAREIGGVRIAVIGPATAERVRSFHLQVDVQPEKSLPEEIVKAMQKEVTIENLKILLVQAEGARDALARDLSRRGGIVDEAVAYRTVPPTNDTAGGIARFRDEGADWIIFTSSSTVKNFAALNLPLPENLKTLSIGPTTSETLRQLGLDVDLEVAKPGIPGVIEALCGAVNSDGSTI